MWGLVITFMYDCSWATMKFLQFICEITVKVDSGVIVIEKLSYNTPVVAVDLRCWQQWPFSEMTWWQGTHRVLSCVFLSVIFFGKDCCGYVSKEWYCLLLCLFSSKCGTVVLCEPWPFIVMQFILFRYARILLLPAERKSWVLHSSGMCCCIICLKTIWWSHLQGPNYSRRLLRRYFISSKWVQYTVSERPWRHSKTCSRTNLGT